MIWQDFQRPANVELEDEGHGPGFGRFLAQPFERGWGTTVGNALRRSLLSSIPGAAITAVATAAAIRAARRAGRRCCFFMSPLPSCPGARYCRESPGTLT